MAISEGSATRVSSGTFDSCIRFPNLACGSDYVTVDHNRSFRITKDIFALLFIGDQLGDGLATLGDHDLNLAISHLVHESEALCLELTSGHGTYSSQCPRRRNEFHAIVTLPWSSRSA